MWSPRIRAALLCAGFAACLPEFDPDLGASTLGDTELPLCGAQGGPCCVAPVQACEGELVCSPDSLCVREPVLLCDADVECREGEVCCKTGYIGTCARGTRDDCPALDLVVAPPQLDYDAVDLRFFDPAVESDRCLIERGCVGGEGWRRLLGLSTVVNNVGVADLLLGSPEDTLASTVTTCAGETRFASFIRYELLDSNETQARQDVAAACSPAWTGRFIAPFDCGYQGIWSGFSQAYPSSLAEGGQADDCGWLDITGLLPGDYTLRVTVNPDNTLVEQSFDNNTPAELPITIPEFEPSAPCPALPERLQGLGAERECGWVRAAVEPDVEASTCVPGEPVFLICSSDDPDYFCGDLRVCDGLEACSFERALNDPDSTCLGWYSPEMYLPCPASGQYSFWLPGDVPNGVRCERTYYDDVGLLPDGGVPVAP